MDARSVDVEMFAVWENGQVGKKDAFKGYITLDLFPRNNKYTITSTLQSLACLLTERNVFVIQVWACRSLGVDSWLDSERWGAPIPCRSVRLALPDHAKQSTKRLIT